MTEPRHDAIRPTSSHQIPVLPTYADSPVKSHLNMLCRLYAHEFPATHVAAIAPGLIDTRIIDTLCEIDDTSRFPALERIHAARGTETLLSPGAAAERILHALPGLREFESGCFVDLRQVLAPEEYRELMAARNRPGR